LNVLIHPPCLQTLIFCLQHDPPYQWGF
jgi:hypothetical protein